jgi:TetR/AcrR family transcriptional regulator, cholesterol catabolism regulator
MAARREAGTRSSRRDEILGVAADLFAMKGFEGTTVRDIADTAGILSGSLYHHFRSKEQIVEEIFTAYFDEIDERWAAVADQVDDPAERFRAMLRELLLAVDRHPGAARMLTNDWPSLKGTGDLQRRWKSIESQARSLIDSAVANKTFRSDIDAFFLYSVGMDVVRGLAGWYRRGSRTDISKVADAYVSLVFDGLTGSPAAKRAAPKRAKVGVS